MKNLITFVFIIVTFINAFDNFVFVSSSPANWKRSEETFLGGGKGLINSTDCVDSGYYLCSSGVACCPIDSICLSSNLCSGTCTSADVYCSDGITCCRTGQYCGDNNLCYTSTTTSTTTSRASTQISTTSKLMAIFTISLTLVYLVL
ncbi:hypothetical protein Glove_40g9 [Diversispora epigaea]|uniref:Uncharacterized protein n=1 Tax=Diversispora epigaea TaxID=1348612 RepID=A0A397JRS4_9GLOM|nr:hypothetical protein Glove_40g9 [Diversispora epigaea]